MLDKMNQVVANKENLENAVKNAISNHGLNEYAITSTG